MKPKMRRRREGKEEKTHKTYFQDTFPLTEHFLRYKWWSLSEYVKEFLVPKETSKLLSQGDLLFFDSVVLFNRFMSAILTSSWSHFLRVR